VAKEIYVRLRALKERVMTVLLVDQSAIGISDYAHVLKLGEVVNQGSKEDFSRRMDSLAKDWLKQSRIPTALTGDG
jgi:ABC-type branched-subunit amino acid transport system ATPase component